MKDEVGYFLIELTKRPYGEETVLVRGSLTQWLRERKARPTKDPRRWVISGWRAVVKPMAESAVELASAVLGKDLDGRDKA